MAGVLDQLMQAISQGRAQPGMLGSGMAGQAGADLQLQPKYKEYVIQATQAGQAPMTFEQWKRMQGGM